MTKLLLTRFQDVPAGKGRPMPLGERLWDNLGGAAQGWTLADPLDRTVALPPPSRGGEGLAVAALHPFRPAYDLPFLTVLAMEGWTVVNSPSALSAFSVPLLPLMILASREVEVYPQKLMRSPLEAGSGSYRVPVNVEVFRPDGETDRIQIHDKGSLDGLLHMVWRADGAAVLREGWEEPAQAFAVIRGRAFRAGTAASQGWEDLAVRAAAALNLDLARVEVTRHEGREVVAAIHPFPLVSPGECSGPQGKALLAWVRDGAPVDP